MARDITTGTVTTSMRASTRPVISWGAVFGGVVSAGTSALWASFWTILGGFVAAGLGGAIGGAVARQPGVTAESSARTDADDGHPVGRAS